MIQNDNSSERDSSEVQYYEQKTISPSLPPPVCCIGIAGASGSGKTTLANAILQKLGGPSNVTFLRHDDYYNDLSHLSMKERSVHNFDHPSSLDTELLISHIRKLKNGRSKPLCSVSVPSYDFRTHSRVIDGEQTVPSRPVILVEGILLFASPILRSEFNVKIYVNAPDDVRLMRRISRDVIERGRTSQDVMRQYVRTVKPMYEEFVRPSRDYADVTVGTFEGGGSRGGEGDKDEGSGEGKNTNVAIDMIVSYVRAMTGQAQRIEK